jgi:hypothetical protein
MASKKRTDNSSHPVGARHICDLSTSAYVSIRQHTSAYVSIRQHTSAYVLRFPPSGARHIYDLSSSGWCTRADSASASVFVLVYARASASVFVLLYQRPRQLRVVGMWRGWCVNSQWRNQR